MKKTIYCAALVLFIFLFFILSGCSRIKEKSPARQTAPDFELTSIYGETIKLSDFKGKTIILDFWATWCPPCRKEIPHFIELQNKYKNKGLVVIGISLDEASPEKIRSFSKDNRINYEIVMGNLKVAKSYGGITGIPTTFIINKEQTIVKKFIGYNSLEVFEKEIKKLLR